MPGKTIERIWGERHPAQAPRASGPAPGRRVRPEGTVPHARVLSSPSMVPTHAPPRSAQAPRFPDRVGRYEILMPIASGGMATVYLARRVGEEQNVALKLTHAHLRQERDFAYHLVEEAKLAAGIHHPNVVSVLDVGEDPLGIYLVMQYVEGDTLGNLVRQAHKTGTSLSVPVGLRVLLDALAGLHAAHELSGADGKPLGLVHRDFTPQNLLVGLDGKSLLTDFGVAKAVTRLGHTATGIVKGKIAYMSPEHARGRPLDRRADVFSAAVIAWELVADRRLHDTDTDVSLLLRVASEQAPPLSALVPDVPPGLEEAVARALKLDKEARCPSAWEFARQLEEAAGSAGMLASHEEVAGEIRRVLGSKLERRQLREAEGLALRARRAALADATESAGVLTPSHRRLVDPRPPPSSPTHGRSWDALHTPLPADEITVQSNPSVLSAATLRSENAALGSGSVSQPDAPVKVPLRLGVAIGAGALLALALIVPLAFVDLGEASGPVPEQRAAPTLPMPSQTPAPTLSIAEAPAVALSSSVPPAAAAARKVDVSANGKIGGLTLGGKKIRIDEPSATVTIEVENEETALRGHATSVDGRVSRVRLEPGQTRLVIWFDMRDKQDPLPPRTVDSPPAVPDPPPLAPNPYGK